ncbi:MAG TPA: response regulator [Gaiellaceae bacterium]|jgi:two-component system response regulator PrrA|nr:response regulator [Gaiellaceae bacterium]
MHPDPDDDRPLAVVADDDEDIRRLVGFLLRRADFRVEEASNGLEALRKVMNLTPDIVVLDINMPHLDGHAVMRILQSNEERKQRVVFLSARATVQDRVAGLELGAVDYVPKPFEGAELVARVKAALERE